MARRLAVALLILVLGTACTRRNEGYCCSEASLCADVGGEVQLCPSGQLCDDDGAEGPAHTCVVDPSTQDCDGDEDCAPPNPVCENRICVECVDDLDCTSAGAPRCDRDLLRCVGCDDGAQCERFEPLSTCGPEGACIECAPAAAAYQSDECPTNRPICDPTGACVACTDHRACDAGACVLAAGTCATSDDVAYVAAGAPGGNTACTSTAKCATVTRGLATNRPYVVIEPGSYQEDVAVAGRDVTLVGYGATLIAASNLTAALTITGNSGNVAVYGMSLAMSDSGVVCDSSSLGSTATLTLEDVTASDNDVEGVKADQCDLVMRRCRVTRNVNVGISVLSAGFDIVNTIIDDNGGVTSVGGVRIDAPRRPNIRFAFNTVVNNRSTSTGYPGISCDSDSMLDTFHSNIVTNNTGRTDNVQALMQNCSIEYSLMNPAFAGDENVTGDPDFTSDYRIGEESAALDRAMPGSGIIEDIDRDVRPADTPDIGADERPAP